MVNTPNYDLDIDSTLGGDNASDYVIPSQKAIKSYVDNNMGSTVDQVYDPTSQAAQSGVAIAGANFLTSSDLTNYVTTDTAQNVTGVKTFVGNKLLKFKGVNSSSKLGFTAFDNNNREVGYLEGAGSGNSAHTFRLGIYDTTNTNYDNKLGFEYYKAKGSDGVLHRYNLLCPPLYPSTTAQDFYIPMSITNGTTTVNADNTGNIDISTLFPSVGNGTITINQGDIQKGTFTVNQSGNTIIDLDAGGGTVDQTFDGTSANAQSGIAIYGALTDGSINPSFAESIDIGYANLYYDSTDDILYSSTKTSFTSIGINNYDFMTETNGETGENDLLIYSNITSDSIKFSSEGGILIDTSSSSSQLQYNGDVVATLNDIPTVGNGTITINQGGTQKGTFTVNQSGNTTINLDAGGSTPALTDLTDVTITSASNGEALCYNGTNWANAPKTLVTIKDWTVS